MSPTFTIALLILHGLAAVALLGAITHQTVAVWLLPRPAGAGFLGRFSTRQPLGFTTAIVVLYVVTFTLGCFLYPPYRLDVRVVLEDMRIMAPTGAFEIKEHLAALSLGLLPAYWYYWRQPLAEYRWTRRLHASFLAVSVWYGFIVGHVLNNLRGLGA